jgi:hypothetical protein
MYFTTKVMLVDIHSMQYYLFTYHIRRSRQEDIVAISMTSTENPHMRARVRAQSYLRECLSWLAWMSGGTEATTATSTVG